MSRRLLPVSVFIGILCLLSTSTPMAQEAWERIAVLGVSTQAVGFGDSWTFAGTSRGVWRSDDQGVTWEQSMDGPGLAQARVVDMVVSPSFTTDHTVFALTERGLVWRSTDADTSFTFQIVKGLSLDASPGTSLAIHPDYNNPSGSNRLLFVGYDGEGLAYTADAGSSTPSWTADGGPISRIYDLAISPAYSTTGLLLVGGRDNDGPLWIRNGTGSWNNKSSGVGSGVTEVVTSLLWPYDSATGNQLVFAGTETHGMYKATNLTWSGGTWNPACDGQCTLTGGCTGTVARVNAMARAAASAAKFIEGRVDGAFLSTNDGGACAPTAPAATILDVEFQPNYNGTSRCYVFFGTPHGLYRKVVGTCAPAPTKRGPEIVDGFAVALAGDGAGQFMGSLSEGLFKCVDDIAGARHNMVRYNNFPNGQIPQIVAVCLDPTYNETYAYGATETCGTADQSILFVAANFPTSPWDNGVYKSTDFGNSWTRMSTNWPTSPPGGGVTVYDLAIDPIYAEGSANEAKLFVGTSAGLYRWDGGTAGWQTKGTASFTGPVYAVGIPPNYRYEGGSCHTVFVSTDNGSLNQVWKNNASGDGTWENALYSSVGTARGRVTAFAFPQTYDFTASNVYVSAITYPSTQVPATGGVYRYYMSGPDWFWQSRTPSGAGNDYAWDIAAEPAFQSSSSYRDLLLATNNGVYKSTDAGSTWSLRKSNAAYAVTYDRTDTTGTLCMAGYQGNQINGTTNNGAGLSTTGGDSWSSTKAYAGYHYLPDDIWASVAHERDPDILFSSSPSMGVFVSEDQGISFRPWNQGLGYTGSAFSNENGPCPLRTGLGITMLAGRRGASLDIVWVGTAEDGIKARYIYYDSTANAVDLDTENGTTPSLWRNNSWTSTGPAITGRWERIEVTPNTGQSYPVWATGQAWGSNSAQGMAVLPSGSWWTVWRTQNSGLPASPETKGVRQGYQSLVNGSPLSGESVGYHLWNYYQVQVPAGSTALQVAMDDLDDAGSMDPDLYVRHGALPTLSLYDKASATYYDETVCINPPADILLNQTFTSLLTEDFASGIPVTWTIVHDGTGGGAAATWTTGNPCSRAIGVPFSSPFAIVDSDCAQSGAVQDESLITPAFNCSMSEQVVLVFDNQFHWIANYGNDEAFVDVSTDGGTNWTNALTMTGADDGFPTPYTKSVDLSVWASGKSSVKVRFRYTGAYDYWWAIDNVRVYEITKPWFIQHNGAGTGAAATWSVGNPCGSPTLGAPMSPPYAVVDTTCSGGGITYQEYLKGPSFNASSYSKVTLTFDYQFNNSGTGASFRVYGSTDGGATWYGYYPVSGNASPGPYSINVSAYMAGKSNCAFRFAFFDDASTPGRWVALDNIQVTGQGPKPGTWYIGIYGYANTTNTFTLTATLNNGCTPTLKEDPDAKPRPESSGEPESTPWPEAPSGSSSWGTISGSGVYKGSGSVSAIETPEAVTWVQRNGTTSPLTNLAANTVVQLSDLTVIAGCTGDVFYSPAPDEGATTWVNATSMVTDPGSNDFRDLLVASNGDVLIAANGTGTGTSAGGVWLSGDKGAHWMRLSQGFDAGTQELTDLMADSGTPPSYYASTGGSGEYARTITADSYPTVTGVSPSSGPAAGGTTVTVTGTGFLGTCPTGTASDCPSPNDSPVVFFGDTEVVPTGWSATSITVTSPAHATGATNVTVRNPDTRRSSTGPTFTYSCSSPDAPVITSCTDYSAYHFTGIRVEWNSPASWGDSGDSSRSLAFYRDGTVNTTLAYSTTARTDNPAIKCTPRTYKLRATNTCGYSADSGSATATDDAEAGAENSGSALKWSSSTQLGWGDVTGATGYILYRGDGSAVANLASGGASVCTAYTGATSDSGAILSAAPIAGSFYWYLATATATAAEGTLGTGTGGAPRAVTTSGACGSP